MTQGYQDYDEIFCMDMSHPIMTYYREQMYAVSRILNSVIITEEKEKAENKFRTLNIRDD